MPCRFFERAGRPGAIWIEGSWPDHQEAQAYLSALSRRGGEGVCYLSAGYTSGWLSGAFDIDLVAVETSCSASGEHGCRFVAREAAAWPSRGDPRAVRNLAALPFAALRALVRERCARDPERALPTEIASAAAMDRDAAAVHIWGPVMVLPYAGPNETLEALELLARDPTASAVSVIVLDLGGAIVDEGVRRTRTRAAGTDRRGLGRRGDLRRPVAALRPRDRRPRPPALLVEKGLEAAVALAFQIARSQKRSL
jgi:hypothetical protein